MNIITMPRQTGKTTLLVNRMRKNPKAILIVHAERWKQDICHKYKIDKNRVFTYQQVFHEHCLRDRHARALYHKEYAFDEILMDEIGLVLEQILPELRLLTIATHTNDYEEKNYIHS